VWICGRHICSLHIWWHIHTLDYITYFPNGEQCEYICLCLGVTDMVYYAALCVNVLCGVLWVALCAWKMCEAKATLNITDAYRILICACAHSNTHPPPWTDIWTPTTVTFNRHFLSCIQLCKLYKLCCHHIQGKKAFSKRELVRKYCFYNVMLTKSVC